jgi:hypothetical protein
MTEFEAFLEKDKAPERELLIVETSYQRRQQKLSKTDAYWEGVLQSEKQRLQQINDEALTSVDAMMVGSSSDDDNGDTTLRRAANKRAKEILRTINEPFGCTTGTFPSLLHCLYKPNTRLSPLAITKDTTDTPSKRATKRRAKQKVGGATKPDGQSSCSFRPSRFYVRELRFHIFPLVTR